MASGSEKSNRVDETGSVYRYGESEGVLLRRSNENTLVEAYRGQGRWEYVETWRWLTETDLITPEEAESMIEQLESERAGK